MTNEKINGKKSGEARETSIQKSAQWHKVEPNLDLKIGEAKECIISKFSCNGLQRVSRSGTFSDVAPAARLETAVHCDLVGDLPEVEANPTCGVVQLGHLFTLA